jgi:integrase/recombinase XerD
MWVEGTANGTYIRRSLKTGSWERAVDLSRIIEEADKPAETPERKRSAGDGRAGGHRILGGRARLANSATRPSTSWTSSSASSSFPGARRRAIISCARWICAPSSRSVPSWHGRRVGKEEEARAADGLLLVLHPGGLAHVNPTDRLGRISVTQAPTDYFTREEYAKLLDATYLYRENKGESIGGTHGTRIRTLIMLMRWSGLRIRDAVTLERTRLINDNLLLYQAKTGTPVYVPLPPQVAEALRTVPEGPKPNPRYFFWSGNGLPKSASCRLATQLPASLQTGWLGEARWFGLKRCFPSYAEGHFCSRDASCGRADRSGLDVVGTRERQNH